MMLPKESSSTEIIRSNSTRKLIDYTKQRRGGTDLVVKREQQERKIIKPLFPLNEEASCHSAKSMLCEIPCEIELMKSSAFDESGLGDSFTSLSDEWKKFDKELLHEYNKTKKEEEEKREEDDDVDLIDFYLKIPSKSSRRQRQSRSSSFALREQFSIRRNSTSRRSMLESVLDKMILEG